MNVGTVVGNGILECLGLLLGPAGLEPPNNIRSYLALAKVVRFLKSKRVSLALKVRTHQGRASGNGDAYIFLLGSPDASTRENPGLG